MFGIGSTELIVILVVALLVLGPRKLPELAKTLGKAMGEFRRMSSDFQRTIDTELDREEKQKRREEEAKRQALKKQQEEETLAKAPSKPTAADPAATLAVSSTPPGEAASSTPAAATKDSQA
ncbi:MAG: TatA/E family twin arginine-targeting protein translocase [Desulfovibrio sp.]|nr:TatA/E family twin arginine-targeting protein translocase [Desulfovibrio sp.]